MSLINFGFPRSTTTATPSKSRKRQKKQAVLASQQTLLPFCGAPPVPEPPKRAKRKLARSRKRKPNNKTETRNVEKTEAATLESDSQQSSDDDWTPNRTNRRAPSKKRSRICSPRTRDTSTGASSSSCPPLLPQRRSLRIKLKSTHSIPSRTPRVPISLSELVPLNPPVNASPKPKTSSSSNSSSSKRRKNRKEPTQGKSLETGTSNLFLALQNQSYDFGIPAPRFDDLATLVSDRNKEGLPATLSRRFQSRVGGFTPYALGVSHCGKMTCTGGKGPINVFCADPSFKENQSGCQEIFSQDAEDYDKTLLEFDAHNRWISELKFHKRHPLLFSSSDDASVCVWKTNQITSGTMQTGNHTHPIETLHNYHSKGIFSMDVNRDTVLTAGKDQDIKLANICGYGLKPTRSLSGFHEGVVKGVNWRFNGNDDFVFASVGNDLRTNVFDTRLHKPAIVRMEGFHHRAVNTVLWKTHSANYLMTSSFDQTICVSDIRKPNSPVFRIKDHWRKANMSVILPPIFAQDGLFILATSPKCDKLNIYNSSTGSILRRFDWSLEVAQMFYSNHQKKLYTAFKNKVFVFDFEI